MKHNILSFLKPISPRNYSRFWDFFLETAKYVKILKKKTKKNMGTFTLATLKVVRVKVVEKTGTYKRGPINAHNARASQKLEDGKKVF